MRFALFALFSFLLIAALPAYAAPMETAAREAIIVDMETGQILFEKNADDKMPTSSMSKVMTMYMIFDALHNGKLTLDQQLPVSEKAWRMQGSKMFVDLNSMIKVEDLIRGVIVQSGNDATIVLAEGLAGSEGEFAIAMTRKAKELGMDNSNFTNASGWPDPEEYETAADLRHYSTARDLATLSVALIQNFPEYYKYYSELDFTYNNIKQGNRNPLLYKNIGADGIKTGHAEKAGYGLIGSAVRDGRRVIMVLNGMSSMDERAQESTRLMEWALASFKNVDLLAADQTITNAAVLMGVEKSAPLIAEKSLKMTLPRMASNNITVQAVYKGPLEAPVKKGKEVGVVRVSAPDMPPVEVPLVAGKDIPRLGFFPALMEKARRVVLGDHASASSPAPATE